MPISSKTLRRERRIKAIMYFLEEASWFGRKTLFILIMGTLASTMFWLPLMVFTVVFGK